MKQAIRPAIFKWRQTEPELILCAVRWYLPPTLRGDAVGHWEGDTLVVDVTSFNDRSWLGGGLQGPPTGGGYFHSYEMHVIERLRREGDRIHYQVTVEDPEVFMEPWTMNAIELKPDPDPKATIVEGSPCNMEYDRTTIVGRNRH